MVVGRAVSSCLVGVSLTFWIGVGWELESPLPLTVCKRQQRRSIPLGLSSALGSIGGWEVQGVPRTYWSLVEPL